MHLIFKILCTFDIFQYLLYNCTGILILCLQIWTSWKNGFLTRKKAKQTKKANPYTDFHNGLYFSSMLKTKETDLQSILILGMNASLFVDRWSHRLERQRLLFLLVSHINLLLGIDEGFRFVYTGIRLNSADGYILLLSEKWDYITSNVCTVAECVVHKCPCRISCTIFVYCNILKLLDR